MYFYLFYRIHGLQSGKTLKIFRGHTSYVNTAIYAEGGKRVISGSSDGTIRVWDAKSTDCLLSFSPASATAIADVILSLLCCVVCVVSRFLSSPHPPFFKSYLMTRFSTILLF